MSVQTLAIAMREAMSARIEREGRAMHGFVRDGKFCIGDKQLEPIQAIDLNLHTGKRVWAMMSANKKAVIVGE